MRPFLLVVPAALALVACASHDADQLSGFSPPPGEGSDAGAGDASGITTTPVSGPPTVPFEAVGAAAYVTKVKTLTTGLSATDAEISAVTADPTALRGLIDQWMTTPQFEERMIEFFRNAFQQNQVNLDVLGDNLNAGLEHMDISTPYQSRMIQSLEDTFPLTVWNLVASGQPFTQAMTTDTYMMTTAEMALLSYLDELQVKDDGSTVNRLTARSAIKTFTFDPLSKATLAETLDPTSPSFMVWADPVPIPTGCTKTPPVVFDNTTAPAHGVGNYQTLFRFLFGASYYLPCYPTENTPVIHAPILADSDFADYRMVKIVPAATTDITAPLFWDVLRMRAATSMTLHVPRIGFSGTLAFEANWGTNDTNESRVTANQSLIVALGQSIDGENTVTTFPVDATDADRASNAACSGCHSQLDPIKQYFRQSYSLCYKDQFDQSQLTIPAGFGIDGMQATGSKVPALMSTMASNPRLALAWAQKLAFWATSTPAEESDPELVRIAAVFARSNYDFKTLAREVFSSPLVTFAAPTLTTTDNGVLDSVARRDQLCAILSSRLGIDDVCGQTTPLPTATQAAVSSQATIVAVDTYYRAYALPALPTNPDLFFRGAAESMCKTISTEVVGGGGDAGAAASRYSAASPTDAIADMVTNVMGLPASDPRSAPSVDLLTAHFTSVTQVGGSAVDALRSTFVLACLAPTTVLLGL